MFEHFEHRGRIEGCLSERQRENRTLVKFGAGNETARFGELDGIDLEPDQIQPAPRIGTHIRTDFIKGMGKRDSQFIMILDIDRIFSAEELATVRGQETTKPLIEVAA